MPDGLSVRGGSARSLGQGCPWSVGSGGGARRLHSASNRSDGAKGKDEMTFTDAAAEVLRLVGRPLHYKEITDLAIKNHQVDALILSVGGFLGMGEHYVAVSPSSVNVRYDSKNDKWLASMNTTKEALKEAPEFKYPK